VPVPGWTGDVDDIWDGPASAPCAACEDALHAGVGHVAVLAAHANELRGGHGLCRRHLRCLLTRVPDSGRAGAAAIVLEGAAAAATGRARGSGCAACSCEEAAARRAPCGRLCLPHFRRSARGLAWHDLVAPGSRLLRDVEDRAGRDAPHALWGHPELTGLDDLHGGDDVCPMCAARAGTRLRHFEWLAQVLRRSPSSAAGSAVALCGGHGRGFADWAPDSGRVLVELAAAAWAQRLRWLLAGLEQRPARRLTARLATLPATLSGLADEEGRLPLADILRATGAAVLRTPKAVRRRLIGTAFATRPCPACAAEEDAARQAAAACRVAVCLSDLELVSAGGSGGPARHAVRRATADRLSREAATARSGASVERVADLAAVRPR
jgi:hypothetical protein